MIKILEKYNDSSYKNNKTVREEFYSALVLNKYVLKKCNMCIGTDPNNKLPDIITEDNQYGFEVVNCETNIDYDKMDIQKSIINNDYVYNQQVSNEIKSFNKKHKPIKLETIKNQNKIYTTVCVETFHADGFMVNSFTKELNNKLTKLKKNRYSGCDDVSLVIINHEKLNGLSVAESLQKTYSEIVKNYEKTFSKLYFLSQIGLYEIGLDNIVTIHLFKDYDINKFTNIINDTLSKL